MDMENTVFRRVFSRSLYRNLKLPLGEMSFGKDFVNDTRGDLYPVIKKDEKAVETVEGGRYLTLGGEVCRMFARFFPFATYELSFSGTGGCGFVFCLPEASVRIYRKGNGIVFSDGGDHQRAEFCPPKGEFTMAISCRPGAFDVFFKENGAVSFFKTFRSPAFALSNAEKTFKKSYVCLFASGECRVREVSTYIDCGISQADIRPIRYENGEPMVENGKLFLTASIRMQEGGFQGIFSWVPTTQIFELTGALFFDGGDGVWRSHLASSILFHRPDGRWYIWTSAFEHRHILCHARASGEIRFGVNVVDVVSMEAAKEGTPPTEFLGFKGDEDADFYYDEERKTWYMAICRLCPPENRYRYVFFCSDHPFEGYRYIGMGLPGSETGGSFVRLGKERAFVCGNEFSKRANYRIYTKDGMTEEKFDFDDGGFRGWGTVIPLRLGTRTRYFHLTFDRHNGSPYNWSYGNIYCFEADF